PGSDRCVSLHFSYLHVQRSTQIMQHFFSPSWMSRSAARFSIVILALMLMAPLAACGGSSSTSTSGTSSGPVTLTYWAWISSLGKQFALFIHITSYILF